MAWVSMRTSAPCVLRHHEPAANDPQFKPPDRSTRWPRYARHYLAVFLMLAAVTAFSLARRDAPAPIAHEEPNWRTPCLIAALGDARLKGPGPRELCAP
jgi:hypothetical protein